jgi:hypothetical protein
VIREKQEQHKLIAEVKVIIEQVLAGQTRMQEDIKVIKENLFDPDIGLYSRVAKNTGFRLTATKWLWLLSAGVIAALVNEYISKLFQ